MGKFRDMILNEARRGMRGTSPVLPTREYVKGNTIEKNVASAIEFFSATKDTDGVIIVKDSKDAKGVKLIYTSGSGAKMKQHLDNANHPFNIVHDQTGRDLGMPDVIGYIDYNKDGIIKIEGASVTDKVVGSYTFK